MKMFHILGFSILFSLSALAAGKKLYNKDLPDMTLPTNETIQVEAYAKKIGAYEGTDGFKATFWCTKLKKPKRRGPVTTDIDCKWVAIE